jgi:hypothetical protein
MFSHFSYDIKIYCISVLCDCYPINCSTVCRSDAGTLCSVLRVGVQRLNVCSRFCSLIGLLKGS